MKVFFTKGFKKNYAKRIASHENLNGRFEQRYDLFVENPKNEVLKDHALRGSMRGLRAFSVTGDIRVVYFIRDNIAYFVDIGTHSQVYK